MPVQPGDASASMPRVATTLPLPKANLPDYSWMRPRAYDHRQLRRAHRHSNWLALGSLVVLLAVGSALAIMALRMM